MRIVTVQAKVDEELCDGCSTCARVCPTLSIKVGEDFIAKVDELTCTGCSNCKERCPEYAIRLVPVQKHRVLEVGWEQVEVSHVHE